jgi:hypothetical protein
MSTKYAYKELNKFDHLYYRPWSDTVKDAFAERDWTDYLITPAPVVTPAVLNQDGTIATPGFTVTFTPDASISARAKAFLTQSLDYKYRFGLEKCTSAAEIWEIFLVRYGQRSRDDELRLEAELLSLVKSATQTLDQYIEKFDNLISNIRAQQEPEQQWDDRKVNMHFIRTLELSNIPNEDWRAWSTYLGSTHTTMSHDSLQAACRTYYTTHMLPRLKTSPQEQVYATITSPPNTDSAPGRGRGGNRGSPRGRGGQRGGRGGNTGNSRGPGKLPTDPNAWCTHCERSGHASNYCYKRYKESESSSNFADWCSSQATAAPPPQHKTPQAPSGNRPSNPPNTQGRSYTIRSHNVRSCHHINDNVGYEEWLYDTACSEHMTSRSEFFSSYDAFNTLIDVHGVNGALQAHGYGDVLVKDLNGNQHTLREVWYIPDLDCSIISKSWTKHSGLRTTMDQNEDFHLYSQDPMSSFHISSITIDKLTYIVDLDVIIYSPNAHEDEVPELEPIEPVVAVTRTNIPSMLMHQRLGHASSERMRLLGYTFKPGKCHECIMGKQTRKPFPSITERSNVKIFRVYSDICPVTPESFGHGVAFIVFVDEATRYVWVFVIPNKTSSTVLQILKTWLPLVERQAGTQLVNLRTDEGGEYTGEILQTVAPFLRERGINHEQTSAYSSASNGIAERMNRTLMDVVRSILLTSGLPAPFWGEALYTAAKIRNRLPTSSLENNISPHQAWFGVAPKISHLRVFGCVCFVKVTHPVTKVQTRSHDACCFLGYEGTTQYRVYDPNTNKVRSKVRDVDFIEDEFLPRTAFLRVPYADRPLQVPEPRNYSEEDVEYDEDELAELFPVIPTELFPDMPNTPLPVIPLLPYMPEPRAQITDITDAADQQARVDNTARIPPLWPIPPPVRRSPDPQDDMPLLPRSPTPSFHTGRSESASQDSSHHSSRPGSPSGIPATLVAPIAPVAPVASVAPDVPKDPAVRQSGRQRKPTQKVVLNKEQANAKARTTALVAHTGPTLHSSSPHYRATWAPPDEPRTLKEALASPYSSFWTTAIEEELASILEHGTYTIVPRPRNRKVVGSKFAFKVKNAETPNPRFKARFVAKGYTQVAHVDYEDTFAPVAKATSVRLALALAGGRRHRVNLFDVETAFLNSLIDREIYLEQPEGYEHPEYPRDRYVLQVNKGIYGLKQAGALYSNDQKAKLVAMGFTPSEADECIFISADKRIIVATYVDDGLVSAENQEEIDWVISELSKHYKLRNLGTPTRFLGMDISRPKDDPCGPITVAQTTYAHKLLAKFEMENCNPVKAPCDQRAAYLHRRTETEAPADAALYRSITSSIMHLAVWTRPDIAWITNKLSQFNSDPSELHMSAAKHLLRYIIGTLDYGFTYSPSIENSLYGLFADYNDFDFTPLHGYSDASGASDLDDRCSTSGYVFFLYGGPIVWGSRKQTYAVALSTMEGEYLALTEAAKEAMFLRNLLASINVPQERATLILTDSEAALKHVKNNVNHPRSKHIDTRHHYIRHVYNSGDVDIRHIPSASQTADILTKPLGVLKHQDAVGLLCLHTL